MISKKRLAKCYDGMIQRCHYPNTENYIDYGGRGIVVCDEWFNNRYAFYDWAINNGYRDDLTIDRIDNNKGYSPDNCRWTTKRQQARNRRSNRNITINGETHCLAEWCSILHLNYYKVSARINNLKWPILKALELEK